MTAFIQSMGIISRCAVTREALVKLLGGADPALSCVPIEFPSQIPPSKMRRNSRYNKLACTAADHAVREAAIPAETDRRRIGTIVSTGYGSSVYYSQFSDTVVRGVPGLCSPAIYSGMVPNACVGQICILNGFKGPSTVLTGGDPLEYASLLLETGKADMILCGSVEEYNPELYTELRELETLKDCELSEGAAMFMLTREQTDSTICKICDFSSASLGQSPLLHMPGDEAAADIAASVLGSCKTTPDAVFTSANGSYFDAIENMAIQSVFPSVELVAPKKWSGETLGCGYMINTLFAAAAVQCGMYHTVLVTGMDLVGNYCTVMIGKA